MGSPVTVLAAKQEGIRAQYWQGGSVSHPQTALPQGLPQR
jgi:hypothetical protein